jgi:predicted dehydrogenase
VIKIGIVGCGWILNSHLRGYKALREAGYDSFRITALAARRESDALRYVRRGAGPPPSPPILDAGKWQDVYSHPLPHVFLSDFQDDTEIEIYSDYREMIERADVDAVNDFTSIYAHHQIGEAALAAGKHLLAQKPPAITVAAGRKLVAMAAQRGLTYGVFESARQSVSTRAAGWAVRKGLIGEPRLSITVGVDGRWAPARIVADKAWHHRKLEIGGHATLDWGVHHFDQLRYVLGEVEWIYGDGRILEPTRYRWDDQGNVLEQVSCTADDTYAALVGLESGAMANMLWSIASRGEEFKVPGGTVIYGSEGCIKGGELIREDGLRAPLVDYFEAEMSDEERERFFPMGLRDGFALEQLGWLRAVASGTKPEVDGEEGLRDAACGYAVLESAALGRRVTLEEVLSGEVDAYQAQINAHYDI